MSTFGNLIRSKRKEKGLTLTQLGAKIGLDSANLSKIENGKRDFDKSKLSILAEVIELDVELLKIELLSDQIAREVYETNCDYSVFKVAEEKTKYLIRSNTKQSSLNL